MSYSALCIHDFRAFLVVFTKKHSGFAVFLEQNVKIVRVFVGLTGLKNKILSLIFYEIANFFALELQIFLHFCRSVSPFSPARSAKCLCFFSRHRILPEKSFSFDFFCAGKIFVSGEFFEIPMFSP